MNFIHGYLYISVCGQQTGDVDLSDSFKVKARKEDP